MVKNKRYKSSKKKNIGSIFMILLSSLLFFTFYLSSVTVPEGPSTDDVNGIKSAIDKYFNMRYESRSTLIPQDFKSLESNNRITTKWLQKEKNRQDIELYVASIYHLNYQKYKYELDYKKIQVNGNRAEINLNENHEVIFEACAPEVSKFYNHNHKITMIKTGNNWTIENDDYTDELSVVMKYVSKEELMETARANYDFELAHRTDQPQIEKLPRAVFGYNRSAASIYATSWCNKFNSLYINYSPNDCANFVSQTIYEGTNRTMSIVNTSHYMDWWYFTGSPRGGSYPWINVNGQKNFLTTNTGQGPYGPLVTSTCSLGAGDVVQLYNGSAWYHAVILDAVTNCADTTKIFFSGHTYARCHYPLAYYASITKRYIHISGYRR